MCGIGGIISFTKVIRDHDLEKMINVINHRGPDGYGIWLSDNKKIGFAHKRLSIIDLSELGKQPMHYKNRYTITFNGEIYNYIEVKNHLKTQGYSFVSGSDTEVVLAAYDYYQEQCLLHFDGMFAMAIWDNQKEELFFARDRFGEKPFYYFENEEQFFFASEIKQLWAAGIPKRVKQDNILLYVDEGISNKYENGTYQTVYEGVKILPPASYLKITKNKAKKLVRYWDVNHQETIYISLEEAKKEFLRLLKTSVERRLRSDVAIGSSLSGGLDSSGVVKLVNELLAGEKTAQKTFSARFKNFKKDEGEYIKALIQELNNVEDIYCWVDSDYFVEKLEEVVGFHDEPFGSASVVAQYAVMELAKKHDVTVLLDGQGADEYLGGYMHFFHHYLKSLIYQDYKTFKQEQAVFNQSYPHLHFYDPKLSLKNRLGIVKRSMFPPKQGTNPNHSLNSMLYKATFGGGLEKLLRQADRNSMAHSIEVRLPYLNHDLVAFVFSLPDSMKLNKGWTKFVMREALNGILPDKINWRKDKVGFEPPQDKWIENASIKDIIKTTANSLGIEMNHGKSVYHDSQNWRLLMASKYLMNGEVS